MDGLKIIPYLSVDGISTIRDSEIQSIFNRMAEDGTAKSVFYDSSILTPNEFVLFVKRHTDLFLMVELDGVPVGAAWYQSIALGVVQGHFCTFSSIWGSPDRYAIGRHVIQFVLQSFNTIVGYVPEFNSRALDYILGIGATEVASIPAFAHRPGFPPASATMIYFTRGQHENLY